MTVFEWLSVLSYGLLAISYAFRSIRWLRLLVLGASMIDLVVCYATRAGQPMWVQFGVTFLIIVINVYQLIILYKEAHPIRFSPQAEFLLRHTFPVLSPGEFNKLLQVGSFETLSPDTQLTRKDTPPEAVYVLMSGELEVKLGDVVIARMAEAGTFVGEMGYITRTNASADVVAAVESRVFRLPVTEIERLRRTRPDLHVKLAGILSGGIAEKLRRSDARLVLHLREQAGSN